MFLLPWRFDRLKASSCAFRRICSHLIVLGDQAPDLDQILRRERLDAMAVGPVDVELTRRDLRSVEGWDWLEQCQSPLVEETTGAVHLLNNHQSKNQTLLRDNSPML